MSSTFLIRVELHSARANPTISPGLWQSPFQIVLCEHALISTIYLPVPHPTISKDAPPSAWVGQCSGTHH